MTVKEFVNKLLNSNNETGFIKTHIATEYVPIANKIALCKNILDVTMLDSNKDFHRDSVMKQIIFDLNIISIYFNIDVNFTSGVAEDYDYLQKYNLINDLKSYIPQYELSEFENVLNLTEKDFVDNKYEIHNYVNELLDRIAVIIEPISESISNFQEAFGDINIMVLMKTENKEI